LPGDPLADVLREGFLSPKRKGKQKDNQRDRHMIKAIKAKYSEGMIKPLEKLEIKEGTELTVIISETPREVKGEDILDVTFGGWAELIDGEELKKNIYADRLISTRQR
jgi:predicted DNA-binding antitoxin AbrB/MazE fold protein